jgi:hypothetical protein
VLGKQVVCEDGIVNHIGRRLYQEVCRLTLLRLGLSGSNSSSCLCHHDVFVVFLSPFTKTADDHFISDPYLFINNTRPVNAI